MADETRNDTADDTQAENPRADNTESDRPQWLIDELQHYLPGVDVTTMQDSEVAAALKKYVDKFHLGQYGDLIDDPGLKDVLERDAQKQALGQFGDQIDDPDLRETLEREAEKQRLGDFGDLVDDPKRLKEALEKEAERQRLGDPGPTVSTPTGANADDPMNPHNTQPGEPPRAKTPEQRMDERLEEKLGDGRPSPGSGTSSGPSMAPSSGNTPGGTSGQTGTSLGAGSPTDTQNLPGGTGSAIGSTTGPASSVGGTSAAGAGAGAVGVGSSGSSGPPSGSTAHGAFPDGLEGGGQMGYRDSDGNWYDENGSPMSTEMAKKMEEAYQKGETVDYDSASGGAEGDGAGEAGGDGADAAPDPPPDNDSEDIEYTAADDVGPRPGTPGFERFQDLSADYIAIRNQARADSTINPVREGYTDATGGDIHDESKSLTGADGDERYDSAATTGSGGSSAGQGYGNSSGSGAITYGPDSDVDFGIGPEDDVPIIDGPPEDLSHLADSITGRQDEPESPGSALPGGMSPSDLKIEDNAPEGLDRAGIIRPVASEPVQYMTGDLQSASGSGGNAEPEPEDFDLVGEIARDSGRPEMIREIPVDDEDDDSGQLAGKDVEIPVVDLDPGHGVDPRGLKIDAKGNAALENIFLGPIIGTATDPTLTPHEQGSTSDSELGPLPEVTEEGWHTIPQQPVSPFDETRVTLDAPENSALVKEVPTSFEPIDFASTPQAINKQDSDVADSRLEPLSFAPDRTVEPVSANVTEMSDDVSPSPDTSMPDTAAADPLIPEVARQSDFKVETGTLPAIEPSLPVDHGFALKAPVDTSDEDDDPGE